MQGTAVAYLQFDQRLHNHIKQQQLRITFYDMFRHLKCRPQGAHCALLKLHTDFMVLVKYSC